MNLKQGPFRRVTQVSVSVDQLIHMIQFKYSEFDAMEIIGVDDGSTMQEFTFILAGMIVLHVWCCWWIELYTTKCNLTSHFFRILADLVLMVYCLFLFCYFLEQEYLTGVDLFQSERHLLAFTLITNLARTQTYRGTSESTPGVRRYELRAPEGQFIVSLKRPRDICAAVSGLVLMAINKPVLSTKTHLLFLLLYNN